jgi:hypothetical protein
MNTHLHQFVSNNLTEAATFVTQFMPMDIDTDEAYEALLSCSRLYSPAMRDAFASAVKYLPAVASFKRRTIKLPNGKTAVLNTQFGSTKKWPQFLFPEGELPITPESKLYGLLALPIKVAQEWAMLRYVWGRVVADDRMNVKIIAHFFPWVRDIVCDFPWDDLPKDKTSSGYVKSVERDNMKREVATIMRADVPNFFPSKTPQLTSVMRSGRQLMAQYRMLKAAHAEHDMERACVQVDVTDSLIPDWVPVSVTEMLQQWEQDKRASMERALEKTVIKSMREFDQKNMRP